MRSRGAQSTKIDRREPRLRVGATETPYAAQFFRPFFMLATARVQARDAMLWWANYMRSLNAARLLGGGEWEEAHARSARLEPRMFPIRPIDTSQPGCPVNDPAPSISSTEGSRCESLLKGAPLSPGSFLSARRGRGKDTTTKRNTEPRNEEGSAHIYLRVSDPLFPVRWFLPPGRCVSLPHGASRGTTDRLAGGVFTTTASSSEAGLERKAQFLTWSRYD